MAKLTDVRPLPRRKKLHLLLPLLCALFLLTAGLGVFFLDLGMSSTARYLAEHQVAALASNTISQAAQQTLEAGSYTTSDLIAVQNSDSGQVESLTTNTVLLNQLRSDIALRVQQQLDDEENNTVSIALGSLIGGELLYGRGPAIPIRYVPTGLIRTRMESEFSSAGINQTQHELVLYVSADLAILLPGTHLTTTVEVPLVVSQTVLVGQVPNSYTSVIQTPDTLPSTIADYGAE